MNAPRSIRRVLALAEYMNGRAPLAANLLLESSPSTPPPLPRFSPTTLPFMVQSQSSRAIQHAPARAALADLVQRAKPCPTTPLVPGMHALATQMATVANTETAVASVEMPSQEYIKESFQLQFEREESWASLAHLMEANDAGSMIERLGWHTEWDEVARLHLAEHCGPLRDVLSTFACKPLVHNGESKLDDCMSDLVMTGQIRPHEHSLYLFDLGSVARRWSNWRTLLPRVQPFYAVKCCNDPGMIATLAALGSSFDCASAAEIDQVQKLGVEADRIIYANPAKLPAQLLHAAACDVKMTTFDTEAELVKCAALHPEAELVLRLRADDPSAQCALGTKYGAEFYEVEGLLLKAKHLGLNVKGVSFHVGSGARDPRAHSFAIAQARAVFDKAEALGLPPLTLLDIGGGFSGAATGSMVMENVAAHVNEALDEHFPEDSGVRVIAEPGRYFAEAAGTLYCNIFSKRVRPEAAVPEGAATHAYWVGDGLYGSFNCLMYDHATVAARPLRMQQGGLKTPTGPTLLSTVFGPTCDGIDTILDRHELPELEVGDWLAFDRMGAYTTAASSAFNGFDTKEIRTQYVVSHREHADMDEATSSDEEVEPANKVLLAV